MLESQTGGATVITDAWRAIATTIDGAAFGILSILYQIFFNVASADLFSNETVMQFYGRIQLILGVYMIFQLTMSIIKGIVNPDTFFKADKNGAGGLITRVSIALILLTLLVPLNTPKSNEYEAQVSNNGLLFGTLYSLQHRILSNNTLGKLVLGTTDSTGDYLSGDDEDTNENLETASRIFTSTIMKCFYRINLLPEEERPKHEDGKDDAIFNDNRVCKDWDDDLLAAYTRVDAYPEDIIEIAKMKCEGDGGALQSIISKINPFEASNEYYYIAHIAGAPLIVAVAFSIVLLGFTVDIAVRAIKLSILRLMAPIPIISYIDPNGSKDSSLNAWVKALIGTYLDLFFRLILVYFVIFLIQDMIVNGIGIKKIDGPIGAISLVLIFLGLFVFARQAPKFIKEILGIKGDNNMFGGFGEILGAAGVGASVFAGGITGWKGSKASQEANWNTETHAPGETFRPNRGKQLASALFRGAMSGGAAGAAAAAAKNHKGSAALGASFKSNTAYAAAAEDGATLSGKTKAYVERAFTGETEADRLERQQKGHETASKILSSIADRGDSKAKTSNWTTGTSSYNGKTVTGNYQKWRFAFDAAQSQGATDFEFNGQRYTLEEANGLDYNLMATNSADYISQRGRGDGVLDQLIDDYEIRYGQGSFAKNATGARSSQARKYFKDESDNRANQASEAKRKLGVVKANANATKPK